jgi:hypothetical protein
VKRLSFAASHTTAPGALNPTFRLGDVVLAEGETDYRLPANTSAVDLVLSEATIGMWAVLDTCKLGRESTLAVIVDLECPGFDLRTTLLHETLDTRRRETSLGDTLLESIPGSIVSEGFDLKMELIAVDPVRTSPIGCATRGGVLSTWQTRIPPRNRTSTFPIEESADEPSLWRLEMTVDDPDDLERPTRAALRLFVDSTRLDSLFGRDADDTAQDQAISWIRAEAFTDIVTHVLVNRSLRAHFSDLLSRAPDRAAVPDERSVGFNLYVLLARTTGPRLDEWYERLVTDPVGTTREIRSKFGTAPVPSGNRRTKGSVGR